MSVQIKYTEYFLIAMIVLVQVLMFTGCGAESDSETHPIRLQSTPEGQPTSSPVQAVMPTVTPTPTPSPTPTAVPVQDPWLDMQNTWHDRDLYWHDTEVRNVDCIKGWHLPTVAEVATLIPGQMPLPSGYAWLDDGVNVFMVPSGHVRPAVEIGGQARVICVRP